ncbi:glycosyltransferase [Paraburkholderia sp. GAS82]|uniref:glycosyltransferase n=1 Tax=Paraburkholderia sp. GAS82 TaxID=3035137 RepID=UPI003D1C32CA
MRLVIDLQGCQTEGSRDRGIGRYSFALANAMIKDSRGHEVLVALNRAFPSTIAPLKALFADILPSENIVLWGGMTGLEEVVPQNMQRRLAAEHLKEAFFRSLNADVIHTSSLFEGFGDSSVATIASDGGAINAVTLYDLIPFLRPESYLWDDRGEDWYRRRILHLTQADIALAISESSRREGIDFLNLPEHSTVTVSCASDEKFKQHDISPALEARLRRRFTLEKPFVMYTGGIDFRKNIDGLIEAYACLPVDIRSAHQLAIVCRAHPTDMARLEALAAKAGLNKGDVVFTGFVTDEEMVALYNLCKVFIFPSIHEGFGLPALEAMSCGAAVIGSDCTSIPEVIGRTDAQFDPLSKASITSKLTHVLQDDAFRQSLIASGVERAKTFSWKRSASRTWDAFESQVEKIKASAFVHISGEGGTKRARPRLAYVSPLPPERIDIASYSRTLLPHLSKYYDIDLVHNGDTDDDWLKQQFVILSYEQFEKNASDYDRVLYHFGNSRFHAEMPQLLAKVSGIVVLHDYFLGELFSNNQAAEPKAKALTAAIAYSHGHLALLKHLCAENIEESSAQYPCNLAVLENAVGIITHSRHSIELTRKWYGDAVASQWDVVPLLRATNSTRISKSDARRHLSVAEDAFVVCSFGIVNSDIKSKNLILQGWLESQLGKVNNCRLVFVGEGEDQIFNAQIERLAAEGQVDNCDLADCVTDVGYDLWLSACDLCIQLQMESRGKPSTTVLDEMASGKHVIVNAHATVREIPDDVVTKLSEKPTSRDLAEALRHAFSSPGMREEIGQRAHAYMHENHSAEIAATRYRDVIEDFANCATNKTVAENFSYLRSMELDELQLYEWTELRNHLKALNPEYKRVNRWLVDITEPLAGLGFSSQNAEWRKAASLLLGLFPENERVYLVKRSDAGQYEILRDLLGLTPNDCTSATVRDVLPDEIPIPWGEFSRIIR